MIRSKLCQIAKIAVPTFNSHRRNGNLPFVIDLEEANDALGRVWARFDLHHAVKLIAAQNLATGQGITWSEAAAIIRDQGIHTGNNRNGYFEPGFFCARVEYRTVDGHQPYLTAMHTVFRGALSDIAVAAEQRAVAYNERARFAHDKIEVYTIAAVNLSQAWHIAKGRAVEAGVEVDEVPEFDLDTEA